MRAVHIPQRDDDVADGPMTLLLCGDVMTGRGVGQVLPCPGDPHLRESYADDARAYVRLAECANGPISQPAGFSWPWGMPWTYSTTWHQMPG